MGINNAKINTNDFFLMFSDDSDQKTENGSHGFSNKVNKNKVVMNNFAGVIQR